MSDHDHFEELAVLSAGGFLADQEYQELREHKKVCAECLETEKEFNELVRSGLPLTVSPIREFLDRLRIKPDHGMCARFLARARREGLVFSPEVQKPTSRRKRPGAIVAPASGIRALRNYRI